MVIEKIKELEATKAKLVVLEKTIASQLDKELAALPATYGYDSVSAFIKAVVAACGGRRAKVSKAKVKAPKADKAAKGGKAAKKAGKAARRKRSVITDETRASVRKLVEEGKTGAEISSALSISLPTVQNIKKALGLVKARPAAAAAPSA